MEMRTQVTHKVKFIFPDTPNSFTQNEKNAYSDMIGDSFDDMADCLFDALSPYKQIIQGQEMDEDDWDSLTLYLHEGTSKKVVDNIKATLMAEFDIIFEEAQERAKKYLSWDEEAKYWEQANTPRTPKSISETNRWSTY